MSGICAATGLLPELRAPFTSTCHFPTRGSFVIGARALVQQAFDGKPAVWAGQQVVGHGLLSTSTVFNAVPGQLTARPQEVVLPSLHRAAQRHVRGAAAAPVDRMAPTCASKALARPAACNMPFVRPTAACYAHKAFAAAGPQLQMVQAPARQLPFTAHRSLHSSARRSRTQRSVVVRASWGAPVDFSSAKVVSNKVLAPGLHQIIVDVGTNIASGYKMPGQYIQAKTTSEGKAGFFAIASAPDPNNQGVLELLIKVQPGGTAEAITQLAAGAELMVSPVQGKGFALDRIPEANFPTVLLFATGSGISPIKAVIESGQLNGRKDIKLYYGTKSPENTAYQELIPTWVQQGVKVVQVFSGNDKKYVQDVFAKEASDLAHPQGVAILLCGHKGMTTTVTDVAKAQGVEQIMLNF